MIVVDWMKIGKSALFFGLALLTGLFSSLQILSSHSPHMQRIDLGIDPASLTKTMSGAFDTNFSPKAYTTGETVYLSDSGVLETVKKMPQKGRPFVYLSFNGLFLVDSAGRLLASADSTGQLDLPVISGPRFQMFIEDRRLVGETFFQALTLLHKMKKYPALYSQLSEIYVHPDKGLVVFTNVYPGIPMLFGQKDLHRKFSYLQALVEQLDAVDIDDIKYFDFRIGGQIIVKENV